MDIGPDPWEINPTETRRLIEKRWRCSCARLLDFSSLCSLSVQSSLAKQQMLSIWFVSDEGLSHLQ